MEKPGHLAVAFSQIKEIGYKIAISIGAYLLDTYLHLVWQMIKQMPPPSRG